MIVLKLFYKSKNLLKLCVLSPNYFLLLKKARYIYDIRIWQFFFPEKTALDHHAFLVGSMHPSATVGGLFKFVPAPPH